MFELVFYASLFLFSILAMLIIVAQFSKPPKYKAFQKEIEIDNDGLISFGTIMVFLDSPDTPYVDLQNAGREFFENYEALNFNKSQKKTFIYALSKHPNAKSALILSCLNKLKMLNPDMQRELDRISNLGLNQR